MPVTKSISEQALALVRPPEIRTSHPIGRGWYVVYTAIKSEFRVELDLRAKGFDTFCPRENSVRVRRGRKYKISRPVFSRYVFVAFDPEREEWFNPIKSTDGVECLLENNRQPVRVPPTCIELLRRAEANGVFDKGKTPQPGEEFRIVDGPFADFVGKVQSAPAGNRIKLLVNYMNRAVATEFSLAAIERIS